MQHDPAGGLRAGHRAAQRRPPDHRRPHRAAVRARPPGHHRDQRRLRPHQTPAAVPVLAAALDDLQGSVLLAVQAQQRGQHVHQRQLRRQHGHQGPRRLSASRFRASQRAGSPSSPCRRRDTPTSTATSTPATDDMRALFDAIINDDPLPEEKNADNTPVPGTPETPAPIDTPVTDARTPTANSSTRSPPNPQDITVQVSNSTGEDGLGATAASELQTHGFNVTTPDDYPGPLTRRRCSSRRATNRPRRRWPRRSPTRPSSASPAWVTSCRWCSAPTSIR